MINLAELWRYREMLLLTIYRDLKVRYTQTILGPLWAIVQPLMQMVVFSIVFGVFLKVDTKGVPYALFNLTALVPWYFFNNGMNAAITSLHSNYTIITKIYFPRVILPLQSILVFSVDFLLAFGILLGMSLWYGYPPTWRLVLVPVFLLPGLVTATGLGLLMSSLSVQFRDVRHFSTHLTMFLFWLSPINYSRDTMGRFADIAGLNPFATSIDGFRWMFKIGELAPTPYVAGSCVIAMVIFFIGGVVFRRIESTLVDVL